MRIGIDIDNVISNFDDTLLKEYLKQDKKLRNTGIVNEKLYIRQGMFDWTKQEEETFYRANIEKIATILKPLHKAKEVIDQLKQEGNEIYLISGRDNGEYSNPRKMTEEWLKKNQIYYDQLLLTNAYEKMAKAIICKKYKIDIMIEDSVSICQKIKENGIKVWLMNTRFNQENKELERVMSWKDIHAKILALYPQKEERIKVILDTDTYNECDDQFAVSYLLKSQDRFDIQAITIAPYQHDNDLAIQEGQEKSYQEVLKIAKWLNFDIENRFFKGADSYLSDKDQKTNQAVENIIKIALKNEKTYILAIGAMTNIAMAIQKEPRITNKIEIVWLGGHSKLSKDNDEFNFRQDIQAVKTIFESDVKLTIIPCKNVASHLITTIYELEHYLKGRSELGNYLCDRFHQDGIHGLQTRRVIWDISAVAYLINKEWFETSEIHCPNIKEDTSYEFDTKNRFITMVNFIHANKIFEDLFQKLEKTKEEKQ